MTRKEIDKYRLMRKLGGKEPDGPEKAKYMCANCQHLPTSGKGLCKASFKERELPFNHKGDLEIIIFCFYFEEKE